MDKSKSERVKELDSIRIEQDEAIRLVEKNLNQIKKNLKRETLVLDSLKKAKELVETEIDQLYKSSGECNHNWEYDGHDSHYDYYKCTRCGKQSKD